MCKVKIVELIDFDVKFIFDCAKMPISDEIIPEEPVKVKKHKKSKRIKKKRQIQLELEEADILNNAQANLVGASNEAFEDEEQQAPVAKTIHWKRLCVVLLVVAAICFTLYKLRNKLQSIDIPMKLPFSFAKPNTSPSTPPAIEAEPTPESLFT